MNLSKHLSITAKKHPSKIAYIFDNDNTCYEKLEKQVSIFAFHLQRLGYKEGDHLALIVWNSPSYVIAMYAAFRIGVVIIPINPLFTVPEMKYILKDADVKAVITMDVLLDKFVEMAKDLPKVEDYIFCDSGLDISLKKRIELDPKLTPFSKLLSQNIVHKYLSPLEDPEAIAMIIYTSGTTGKPKGVMLSHKNIYENIRSFINFIQIGCNDRIITTLPMFHILCLTSALWASLFVGGTIIITQKFSPKEVFRIAKKYEATIFAGVPTMYNYLLQTAKESPRLKRSFATVRLGISAGAAIPTSLLNEFEKNFTLTILEGYGLTEAAPITFNQVVSRKPGSVGKAVTEVEVKVVNEDGKEVEVGKVGEIIVRGESVMKGYYNLPDETSRTIKNGWLYTGDLGRMDEDGHYYIVDRKKDLIIVSGYNIYPREIEEVLYSYPNVKEAAVVSHAHPDTGECIVAYVSIDNGDFSEKKLIEYCQQHLVKYKIPSQIYIVDELPKNGIGKIQKSELQKMV